MTTTTAPGPTAPTRVPGRRPDPDERARVRIGRSPVLSDRVFRVVVRAAGTLVLVIMGLVGIFLTLRGLEALRRAGWGFFTTADWNPDSNRFGIAAVITGSVLIGLTAIVVALPLALGTSLFLSEYAPQRIRRTLVSLVDLMAAVPSVVFGLWGFYLLMENVTGFAQWVATYFGWIPIFKVDGFDPSDALSDPKLFKTSTFIAGIVVGLMVTPIATSVMREAFSQAPLGEREGALALGGTKWGMIRTVVLPFGLGGIIGGIMLALGRALGETITVYIILSQIFVVQIHILQTGGSSVSALIANRYGESSAVSLSALMAAGLALFVLTLIVNFAAASIVARSRSGAQSEG